jgi:hypothetical protein
MCMCVFGQTVNKHTVQPLLSDQSSNRDHIRQVAA